MDPTWEKRQPRLRSPAELRTFYAIPLSRGHNGALNSGQSGDSRRTLSPSWASSDSSSGSTSLFSDKASAVSSATSTGDYKKPDALSPTTKHKLPTTTLTLYSSYSPTPDTQTTDISIATVSELVGEGREPIPEEAASDVARRQDNVRGDLPHLKSLRLEIACQRCTNQHLGCDKARPCCRNCEQNNQQCCYHRDEATALDERSFSPTKTPVQACLDPISWLNTLREHPYHNLERDQKFSRVEGWLLMSRRGVLFQNQKENLQIQAAELLEDPLATTQLILDSNSNFDDEVTSVVGVDDAGDVVDSLPTLKYCYPPNNSCDSSSRTILLDLGASFASNRSTDSLWLSQRSVSTSSECHFQEPRQKELGDVVEIFPRISWQRIARSSFDESRWFYCVFCFERFGNRTDWEDHELSQHLEEQRDWICMPWGPVEKYEENGEEFCVFCDIQSPSESHCLEHEGEYCAHSSIQERTYRCKEDLEHHFWHMHGHREMTPGYLNSWSFEPEYEDWYWQCGFCDKSLSGWTDRVRHIGNHFQDGFSMLCWDPSVTAGPISKSTGSPVAWLPALNTDQEIRRILKLEKFSMMNKTKHRCEHCNTFFRNHEDAKLHLEKWHLRREFWICPTQDDLRTAVHLQTGPWASYLFPSIALLPKSTKSQPDACPYCGDYAEDIFEGHDDDSNDCFADWEIRIQHLEERHAFDTCGSGTKFYRADQFLLHLAGTHNLRLNHSTKEVMDSCKRTELRPQQMVDVDPLSLIEGDDEPAC